jgi:hypothetical protein
MQPQSYTHGTRCRLHEQFHQAWQRLIRPLRWSHEREHEVQASIARQQARVCIAQQHPAAPIAQQQPAA